MAIGLKIEVDQVNSVTLLRLEGRLDATSAPILEERLAPFLEKKHPKILLDFSGVDYLSSAGMRLLLSNTKKVKLQEGVFALSSLGDEVMEIIKMAGFERILAIFNSETEALKQIASK